MPIEELPGSALRLAAAVTPRSIRPLLASTFDYLCNALEWILGRRDPLTPPLRIRLRSGPFLDARDYRRSAKLNLRALQELCGILPNSHVLDIGCGSGRMAVPLSTFLSPSGSYDGFDLAAEPVAWCQKQISLRFPNFHFKVADVASRRYNPRGAEEPSHFRFPYQDNRFDIAFAGSVFTHLLPGGIANYLRETCRVLRPGGSSLATFCLLNIRSIRAVREGRSFPPLSHDLGDCRVRDPDDAASFIAIPEVLGRRAYSEAGLEIVEPIRFGSWASDNPRPELEDTYGFNQDVVVARKRSP